MLTTTQHDLFVEQKRWVSFLYPTYVVVEAVVAEEPRFDGLTANGTCRIDRKTWAPFGLPTFFSTPLFTLFGLQLNVDEDEQGGKDQHPDNGLLRVFHDQLLIAADEIADPGEDRYPDPRAE